jgi:hypothetical protein
MLQEARQLQQGLSSKLCVVLASMGALSEGVACGDGARQGGKPRGVSSLGFQTLFLPYVLTLRISYPPQFRSEMAAQAMQELVQKMTDKCFTKCTGKSGNRLESKVTRGGRGERMGGEKGRGQI